MRKRSATTSSTLRGPVGDATSRSACTRVKPLAASHCSISSALVLAGSSTGNVTTRRGSSPPRRPVRCHQLGVDRLRRVVAHPLRGLLVEQLGGAREQQLQVVVQLGHRADRRARAAHRVGLVDRDRRRHAVDLVDRRPVHAVEELARVGAEGLDVAALAFGVQRVEHQARLARAARPGDDRHLAGADVEVEVLEVVLSRAADADDAGGHREGPGERANILGRLAWVAAGEKTFECAENDRRGLASLDSAICAP